MHIQWVRMNWFSLCLAAAFFSAPAANALVDGEVCEIEAEASSADGVQTPLASVMAAAADGGYAEPASEPLASEKKLSLGDVQKMCKANDKGNPPICPSGQSPVWVTSYGPTRSGEGAAVYCSDRSANGCCDPKGSKANPLPKPKPLCPPGTSLLGQRIGSCGCGPRPAKGQGRPGNWIDLPFGEGVGLACWVCVALPKGCTDQLK